MKNIPKFKNKQKEDKFWQEHDSFEYIDWSKARPGIFSNLKPTTRLISIRFPQFMIDELKIKANKMDIPYQSLIKKYVASGLKKN